jgi:hypothetical protein
MIKSLRETPVKILLEIKPIKAISSGAVINEKTEKLLFEKKRFFYENLSYLF